MFQIVGKRCNTSLNIGTGRSEQILYSQVRLFRDSSISHSASTFVANKLVVKSLKMNLLDLFFSMATAAEMASGSIVKQSW